MKPLLGNPDSIETPRRAALPHSTLAARSNQLAKLLVETLLVAMIVVTSVIAFTPLAPQFPAAALDSGWAFALNVAVAKGLVFGRDIVFTFGPYASTYTQQYYPATDVQSVWSGALLGIAFACGVMCLSRGAGRVGAVLLCAFLTIVVRDALFLAVPFAFLLVVCRTQMPADQAGIALTRFVRFTLAVLAVALALVTLVKGTFALAGAGALVLGVALLAMRGQRSVAIGVGVIFVAAVPAFWTLAGQPLAALPQFFAAGLPIVNGYTEAMSIRGVTGEPILFLACCAIVGLFYARFFRRGEAAGAVLLAGGIFLLFVTFKAGFVRQDWHVLIAAGGLAGAAWMLALGTPRPGALLALAVALAGWGIIDHDQKDETTAQVAGRIGSEYGGAWSALRTRARTPDQIPWAFQDALSRIRSEQPLPKLVGSVDIYSYGQSVLLARDPLWSPRPVLQSYSAYTPELERIDAAHLTGPDAPANVLFAVQPIDRRLPALEDGLSWPELLTRYGLDEVRGDLGVMHRLASPTTTRPIADAPLAGGSFRLGEPIPVPLNAPAVWARIALRPTPLGSLLAFFDKPPEVSIDYQFADGTQRRFRYVAAMGTAGFVISPLVENTTDFLALAAPASATYFEDLRPTNVVISAGWGAGTLWASPFTVEFLRLRIPSQPTSGALFDPVLAVHKRAAPTLAPTRDCAIVVLDVPPGARLPVTVKRFLRVVAWVGTSPQAPVPTAATFVLRTHGGKLRLIGVRPIPRGDVGGYVDLPPTDEQTYASAADLYGAAGSYTLGLELTRGGRRQACAVEVPIRVASHALLKSRQPRKARSVRRRSGSR